MSEQPAIEKIHQFVKGKVEHSIQSTDDAWRHEVRDLLPLYVLFEVLDRVGAMNNLKTTTVGGADTTHEHHFSLHSGVHQYPDGSSRQEAILRMCSLCGMTYKLALFGDAKWYWEPVMMEEQERNSIQN